MFMTHTPESLHGPSDIIAALPGIFGFYPQESTVVVGLYPPEHAGGAVRLGPVMRADLCHTHHILPALTDTPGGDCVAFYAIVISRIPNSQLVADTKEALFNFADGEGIPLIDACWHVSEVAEGTPYTIVFGPSPAQLAAGGMGPEWMQGTVSSVASSPSMVSLLRNGGLPELDRADTFRFFEPWGDAVRGHPDYDPDEVGARAAELAQACELACDADRRTAAGIIEEGCALLHDVAERPLIQPLECTNRTRVFGLEGDATEIAALLSVKRARDAMIIDALASPLRAATAFLWVAKAFRGDVRANALTLWATVATARNLNSWAVVALTCAQEEVPGHHLSLMLLTMLNHGMQEKLVESAVSGCALSWADLDPAWSS
ncbi:protein of unknown function [Corynebacterium mycetoides]|uniref:DUF4192 domain-containing protein n=2 Tax=Corynebacterium mycetoides TaxID=38302 RepID=A0A1G9MSZ8_9CORY|nr:protein of unknown function [Corynebacterium mycetoides]